jgi:hypothetical protein
MQEPWSSRATLPGLLVVLVATPLAFGGVVTWAWAGLLVTLSVLFLGQLADRRFPLASPPLLAAAGIGFAVVAVQLLPAFGPLTVDRHATIEAALKAAAYVLAFLVAALLARVRERALWLLGALVAIGAFEALYGLMEQASGSAQIFGVRKPTGHTVSSSWPCRWRSGCSSPGAGRSACPRRRAPGSCS